MRTRKRLNGEGIKQLNRNAFTLSFSILYPRSAVSIRFGSFESFFSVRLSTLIASVGNSLTESFDKGPIPTTIRLYFFFLLLSRFKSSPVLRFLALYRRWTSPETQSLLFLCYLVFFSFFFFFTSLCASVCRAFFNLSHVGTLRRVYTNDLEEFCERVRTIGLRHQTVLCTLPWIYYDLPESRGENACGRKLTERKLRINKNGGWNREIADLSYYEELRGEKRLYEIVIFQWVFLTHSKKFCKWWGSTFGTTKCRTADISKFRIFKSRTSSYSIFLF